MPQFVGFGVQVELKDGKLIQGKIAKATSKGLTLNEVKFGDGGTSQAFKVRASRLKDLKVLTAPPSNKDFREQRQQQSQQLQQLQQPQQQQVQQGNSAVDWQDDDVSKIKMQDDFDFEGNLRMFNKKDVFAELKQKDEIDPQNRLVSHNRKPTQNGDAKLQIDEMVIPNAKDDAWDQLSSDDDDDDDDEAEKEEEEEEEGEEDDVEEKREHDDEDDNGNNENNEECEANDSSSAYLPVTKSINITHLLHKASSGNKVKDKEQEQMLAQLEQMIMNQSRSRSFSNGGSPTAKPLVLKTRDTKQTVPMATPVQLLEIERVNSEQYGITSNIMVECFAMNASFFLKQKLGGRARLRLNNNNPGPLVVILTSDSTRSGARAMALGRHMCQSGHVRVIALFTCPSNDLQDSQVKEQFELFKKCGGKAANTVSALESAIEKLNSPVEMIVDAMQGFDCNLTDLYEDNYMTQDYDGPISSIKNRITNMISWSNQISNNNSKQIWSLDIPSGYDSSSGLRNFELAVEATGILNTEWPLTSIHNVKADLPARLQESVVIDMGTPQRVYSQRTSLRKFQACDLFVTEGHQSLEL